jgi:hypothetical protein
MRQGRRARTKHCASLGAVVALAAFSVVSCARHARDASSTTAATTDSTQRAGGGGAVCALDPDVPWLTAGDRACERDLDCTTVVARQCAMFAVAARAAASVTAGEHACPSLPPPLTGCMCSTPMFEQRCMAGCCQSRIAGSNGTWRP